MLTRGIVATLLALALGAAPAAGAPQPYRSGDAGDFFSILPPGTDGGANIAEIGAHLAGGSRPPHSGDQLQRYADLIKAPPGLRVADLGRYFVDASFGVRAGQVERQYAPRPDVTIQRDAQFGIAHVYGDTREGTMFGAGYAQAEDRMFFMDVLRHAGRASLSGFAGGAPGNRAFERDIWELAPYTEAEREAMFDNLDDRFGPDGAQAQRDVLAFCEGVNAFVRDAQLDPSAMPGEYVALGKTPEPWKPADVVAIASLINGVLGKGGGGELEWAEVLRSFERRFGGRMGRRLWEGFRSAHDPEAPLTVRKGRFPYQSPEPRPRKGATVLPDPGTLERHDLEREETGSAAGSSARARVARGDRGGVLAPLPRANSNALLVSAAESETGHPLAVFGPQAAYFSPQIFHDLDLHGPGIDARGATVPGVGFYPVLARGRDYAWSATSAGQDIIDVFATPLCEPGGGTPSKQSMGYELRGQCLPMEVLEQHNSWEPNFADSTPAGSVTYRSERTRLGVVTGRALVGGKPWVFTKLRSTYFHEADLAIAFLRITNPATQRSFDDFRQNVDFIGASYNWFYVDSKDIGYQMSGLMPLRPRRVDPLLPTSARFAWRGWTPETNDLSARFRLDQRPHVRNQAYITDWNNKQAAGFQGAENNTFSSVFRMQLLDDRVRRLTAGNAKASLPELVEAMAEAATVDLRGDKVAPVALDVVGRTTDDDELRGAVELLRDWITAGAHRRDRDGNGRYEHAEAVRIMDAWWPRLVRAVFEPKLGKGLYETMLRTVELDNKPSLHQGSAFQTGWYGFVHKDLRAVLGRRVKGRFARRFCGNGRLSRCRAAVRASLKEALAVPASEVYKGADCDGGLADPQMCNDAILHTTAGGISQPAIPWQNRPTFQQAVEVRRSVGR